MLYRENGQFKTSYAGGSADPADPAGPHSVFVLLAVAFVAVPMLASEYLMRAILIPS
jgi:branched-chain amino acid transport system permease protein